MPHPPTHFISAMRQFGGLGAQSATTQKMREHAPEIFNALSRIVAEWDDETTGNSPSCPDCRMPLPRPADGRLCAYHEAVRVLARVRGEQR